MTPQERIKADADAATKKEEKQLRDRNAEYGHMVSKLSGYKLGYIAGATAEHDRAKVLVDALEAVKRKLNWIENADELEIIRKALEQWKGKEAEDENT